MNVIPLQEKHKPALFELLRACLGEKVTQQRNESFWAWKHEQNPFGPSLTWLAEEQGNIIGLRTFLRWQHGSGSKSYNAVRAVDTATHPDYQRRGIFKKLTINGLAGLRDEGVDYVFNTPNRNSMPGYLKMGWLHVGQLPMYVKVLRPLRFAKALVAAKLFRIKNPNNGDDGVDIIEHPPLAADWFAAAGDLSELLAQDALLRGPGLTTRRSPDYLHWRYVQHPQVCYYAEEIGSGEQRAVVFCRENHRFGLRELMINDILMTSNDPGLVRRLLKQVMRKTNADYLIAHFGTGSAHLDAIKRAGFFKVPGQGMALTVNPLVADISPDPGKIANWSLCLGDLEIF
jgi:GNAT superfamily N-acetyltransferase